jgi:hypothetical protein
METKQTAVGWLEIELKNWLEDAICLPDYIFEQAKQMEKEQIKDAFVKCWVSNITDGIECKLDAEQYYNETYGK